MKLLKIKIEGLPLYSTPLEIDFYAQQNVIKDKNEMLTNLFSNVYTNNVLSVIGMNASGKTLTLKAISFVLQMLQNKPINHIESNDFLHGLSDTDMVNIEVYLYDKGHHIYKLMTHIINTTNTLEQSSTLCISDEMIWKKHMNSVRSKRALFIFNEWDLVESRDSNDFHLPSDVSIMIGLNRKHNFKLDMIDSIQWTNINGLRVLGELPLELVKFLDPSVEYLRSTPIKNNDSLEIKLKFIEKNEITLNSPLELEHYLSSGTIKGINIFVAVMMTLKSGGYLIIDELENHFNIEIVSTLIRFFTDVSTNKNGATILFSTHYTELIDNLERNDCIYITRNMGGIRIDNLNNILTRNDVKKSEWFQSGYLESTTPSYQRYIDFKRILVSHVNGSEE